MNTTTNANKSNEQKAFDSKVRAARKAIAAVASFDGDDEKEEKRIFWLAVKARERASHVARFVPTEDPWNQLVDELNIAVETGRQLRADRRNRQIAELDKAIWDARRAMPY